MNLLSGPGLKYYFWVGVSLILIFTFLEPAGAQGSGIYKGFTIWAMQIGLLLPMLIGLHITLQKIKVFNELNPWFKLTVSGMLGSVLFIPFGLGIDCLFALDDCSSLKGAPEMSAEIMDESAGILFSVTLTWLAINAPHVLQLNFTEKKPADTEDPSKNENETLSRSFPQFFSFIPKEIGTDILFLKSELHYVRVVTTMGEKLILYNLKDAISDLEKIVDGIKTHRSYWVSETHTRKLITEKGGKFILMSNGEKVPVSRRKLTSIQKFIIEKAER